MSDLEPVQDSPPQPPHDVEAEEYVIRSCIIWPDDYLKPARRIIADHEPWYVDRHRMIWNSICSLADKGIPIEFSAIVKDRPSDDWVDGFLNEMLGRAVHGDATFHHAKTIVQLRHQRDFHAAALKLSDAARRGELNGEYDALIEAKRNLDSGTDYKPPSLPYTGLELLKMDPIPIQWILRPLLAKGKLTQLQGEPKGGKSVFALYTGLCAALGYWTAGEFSLEKKSRVLFLAAEDASNLIQERVKAFYAGLGIGGESDLMDLIIFPQEKCAELMLDLAEPKSQSNLESLIEFVKADVVILDSLSNFNSAEENSKKEMQPIMSALRRIAVTQNVAALYLHHLAKPSANIQRSIVMKGRGSGVIAAAWDILVDWGDRGNTNTTPIEIKSKLGGDGTHDVVYDDTDKAAIKWSVGTQLPKEDNRKLMKKILAAIPELFKTSPNGVKVGAICGVTNLSDETVRRYLDLAFNEQQVDRKKGERNAWFYFPVPTSSKPTLTDSVPTSNEESKDSS